MILVSAIITTHNRIEHLKKAISSVLSQTYTDIECIVVSDNSSDGTNEYCSNISNIHFINIPATESKGGNYARNIGIEAANGDYIAFLDDDDIWFPEKIEKQLKLALETDCSFVYCRRYFQKKHYHNNIEVEESSNDCPIGDLSEKIFEHYVSSTSCYFVKKTLLNQINGFDEKVLMWQDYDLFIRLAQLSYVFCVDEPLVVYTLDELDHQKVSNCFDKVPKSMWYFLKKHLPLVWTKSWKTKLLFIDHIISEVHYRALKLHNKRWIYICKPWIWISYRIKETKD